jgi:hypothetical protein
MRSWTMELKNEVYSTGLVCMSRKQQDCNLREIKVVKDKCNDIERQSILAKFSERSSLTLYREINFSSLFEERKK